MNMSNFIANEQVNIKLTEQKLANLNVQDYEHQSIRSSQSSQKNQAF